MIDAISSKALAGNWSRSASIPLQFEADNEQKQERRPRRTKAALKGWGGRPAL
jgi:hypothetical protein